jgi:hypothetical protein
MGSYGGLVGPSLAGSNHSEDPTYVLNLSGLSSLRHADGELLLSSTNEALGVLMRGSECESILDAFERLHY